MLLQMYSPQWLSIGIVKPNMWIPICIGGYRGYSNRTVLRIDQNHYLSPPFISNLGGGRGGINTWISPDVLLTPKSPARHQGPVWVVFRLVLHRARGAPFGLLRGRV